MAKQIRNKLNRIYKTTRKYKYKAGIFFFLVTLFFIGAISYKLNLSPSPFTGRLETESTDSATVTPRPYTEEMRQWNEKTRARIAEQKAIASANYVFKSIDLSQVSEKYHTDANGLSSRFLEPVECLVNSFNNEKPPTINIDPDRISDKRLLTYVDQISNYEFSDEYVYKDIDGSTKIANNGEKSKHNVTFNSICRLNNIYFFAFNSYGEKTHIGGGGSAPSRFAFSDGLGNLAVLEEHNSEHIELPEMTDSSLTKITGSAYYGCRQIYAANNLEVLYGCAGGDGPVGTGGLFLLNLNNKVSVEKIFCAYSSVSKYETLCFNEDGQVYYQVLN